MLVIRVEISDELDISDGPVAAGSRLLAEDFAPLTKIITNGRCCYRSQMSGNISFLVQCFQRGNDSFQLEKMRVLMKISACINRSSLSINES